MYVCVNLMGDTETDVSVELSTESGTAEGTSLECAVNVHPCMYTCAGFHMHELFID